MNHTRLSWVGVIAAATLLATCRGGCHRGDDRAATVEGRLALFPAATRIVASIDVAKLRASPAAAKLAAQAKQNAADQREIEDFARRTHFDPLRQLNSVTVAFPEEARARGELGMVLRADHLDEARLVAYARDQLQKSGDDLTSTAHGRLTLWSSKRNPDMVGFFLDDQTFVLGAGGWGREDGRPGRDARAPVTAPPRTWTWSTWSSAPPAATTSGRPPSFPRGRAGRCRRTRSLPTPRTSRRCRPG